MTAEGLCNDRKYENHAPAKTESAMPRPTKPIALKGGGAVHSRFNHREKLRDSSFAMIIRKRTAS
jgi:hypothetical protein